MTAKNILFIGAGNMGSAIIRGLLQSGYASDSLYFVEPSDVLSEELANQGLHRAASLEEGVSKADAVILCIKPQIFKTAAGSWKSAMAGLKKKPLFMSIMAGVSRKTMLEFLGEVEVTRIMPNLPMTVGKGVAAIATDGVSEESMTFIKSIFSPIAVTVEVPESGMDAVTGVSGSGPAYVFEFVEGLIRGGVQMGLSRETATALTLGTLEGSLEMLRQSGKSPAELSAMVSSPGGTTIAAIQAMENAAFRGTLMKAVEAATQRSKELG
ncbi:MAG: pyrroline-5-carboxylate reductase [Fibrobacter sp.]|jgi:pyrroline-5-carboxylate reductase|nr:pyrroline-5-carboxylate reductase [Fibrobacter sp.]